MELQDIIKGRLNSWSRAFELLYEYGLKWVEISGEDGYADYITKTVYSPAPTTPQGFAIFCHEVGHLVNSTEDTAWRYTMKCIDRFNVPKEPVLEFLRYYQTKAPALRNILSADMGTL